MSRNVLKIVLLGLSAEIISKESDVTCVMKVSQLVPIRNIAKKKISETYSELCQTLEMVRFAKIVNGFKPLTTFAKGITLDI